MSTALGTRRGRAGGARSGPGLWSRLRAAPVLVLLAFATSCSVVATPGNTITEPREVNGITKVDLAGSGEVLIEQTGTESLTIEAGKNVMPHLTSDVSDGTLTLGVKPRTLIMPGEPITYRLTVQNLTAITVSGSGSVSAPKLTTDTLTCSISGSGTVTVAGNTDRQQVAISGSGSYDARSLTGKTASVVISGSGDAEVAVTDSLDVQISGSGSVRYHGDPTVSSDVSGSGSVTKS
jgi:Putative auto-transporter adhesin, head GIN domain